MTDNPPTVYFKLTIDQGIQLQLAVWAMQDAAQQPRSAFSLSGDGENISIWTQDPAGTTLVRQILAEWEIDAEESTQQQVTTWLDGII